MMPRTVTDVGRESDRSARQPANTPERFDLSQRSAGRTRTAGTSHGPRLALAENGRGFKNKDDTVERSLIFLRKLLFHPAGRKPPESFRLTEA
jgi:hypothetical protein